MHSFVNTKKKINDNLTYLEKNRTLLITKEFYNADSTSRSESKVSQNPQIDDYFKKGCVNFTNCSLFSLVEKMSHTGRKDANLAQPLPEGFFDMILIEQCNIQNKARDILDEIITEGAKRLYNKYVESQVKPYASRTLAHELVANASWANEPFFDNSNITADCDEDLELPPIDEWAGGVLPVRGKDETGLRPSVPPVREPPKTTNPRVRLIDPNAGSRSGEKDKKPAEPKHVPRSTTSSRSAKEETPKKPKVKPAEPEAVIIARQFEEAKKKTGMSMKAVTVDADFSVIQINEPKNLPPTLIVPKVTTKRQTSSEPPKQGKIASRPTRKPITRSRDRSPRKKALPKMIDPDLPVFDEEITRVSYSDKLICEPGVTIRDGQVTKSRAPLANPNQMTRAQYQAYLEEMMKSC